MGHDFVAGRHSLLNVFLYNTESMFKSIFKCIAPFVFAATLLAAETPPNFIIIYADDLGYADTSVQMMDADPSTKHKFIQTPGLDKLAELGTRYTASYSPTPTCTGSRISIQHGQSPAKIQYRYVFDAYSAVQRPDGYDDEITIAVMLKDAGKK